VSLRAELQIMSSPSEMISSSPGVDAPEPSTHARLLESSPRTGAAEVKHKSLRTRRRKGSTDTTASKLQASAHEPASRRFRGVGKQMHTSSAETSVETPTRIAKAKQSNAVVDPAAGAVIMPPEGDGSYPIVDPYGIYFASDMVSHSLPDELKSRLDDVIPGWR